MGKKTSDGWVSYLIFLGVKTNVGWFLTFMNKLQIQILKID
jgi:hypothetical protein